MHRTGSDQLGSKTGEAEAFSMPPPPMDSRRRAFLNKASPQGQGLTDTDAEEAAAAAAPEESSSPFEAVPLAALATRSASATEKEKGQGRVEEARGNSPLPLGEEKASSPQNNGSAENSSQTAAAPSATTSPYPPQRLGGVVTEAASRGRLLRHKEVLQRRLKNLSERRRRRKRPPASSALRDGEGLVFEEKDNKAAKPRRNFHPPTSGHLLREVIALRRKVHAFEQEALRPHGGGGTPTSSEKFHSLSDRLTSWAGGASSPALLTPAPLKLPSNKSSSNKSSSSRSSSSKSSSSKSSAKQGIGERSSSGSGGFSALRGSGAGTASSFSSFKAEPLGAWLPFLVAAVVVASLCAFSRGLGKPTSLVEWEFVDPPPVALKELARIQREAEALRDEALARTSVSPSPLSQESASPPPLSAAKAFVFEDKIPEVSSEVEKAEEAWAALGAEQRRWLLEDRGLSEEEVEWTLALARNEASQGRQQTSQEEALELRPPPPFPAPAAFLQQHSQRESLSALRRELLLLTLRLFTRRAFDQGLRRPPCRLLPEQLPLEREAQLLLIRLQQPGSFTPDKVEAFCAVMAALQEEDLQAAEEVRVFAEKLSGGGGAQATLLQPSEASSSAVFNRTNPQAQMQQRPASSRRALLEALSELRTSLQAGASGEAHLESAATGRRLAEALLLAVRLVGEQQRRLGRRELRPERSRGGAPRLRSWALADAASLSDGLEFYTDQKLALRAVVKASLSGAPGEGEEDLLQLLRLALLLL